MKIKKILNQPWGSCNQRLPQSQSSQRLSCVKNGTRHDGEGVGFCFARVVSNQQRRRCHPRSALIDANEHWICCFVSYPLYQVHLTTWTVCSNRAFWLLYGR